MRAQLGLLGVVPFLMVLGNSMLFPVFPKMAAALGLSKTETGLVVTAFSVPAGLLIPLAGYLADNFGRKRVMVPGVALFGLGSALAGLAAAAASYPLVLAARVVEGIGAASMSQLATAMAADIFASRERGKALGFLEAANGVGKVLSPIAGALAGMLFWSLPLWIPAVLAGPCSFGLWRYVREPEEAHRPRPLAAYARALGQAIAGRARLLGAALGAAAVAFFLLFGTLFYLAEVLEKGYGLSELRSGLVLAVPVATLALSTYAFGLVLQAGPRRARPAVAVGLAVLAAAMATSALSRSLGLLLAAITGMGLGGGLVLPSLALLVTSSVSASERGLITSLYGAVRFFGVALGPPVFGALMRLGRGPLFAGACALAAITGILAWILLTRSPLRTSGGGEAPRLGARRSRLLHTP